MFFITACPIELIVSDNGSPISSCIPQIKSFLDDEEVRNFLRTRNIKVLNFKPYPPGASFLGGFVESLVKQVKNTIYGSISRNILTYDHFYFLVRECNMLINKRPVGYKKLLTNPDIDPSVTVITPEKLLKGYDVPSISIVPHLNGENPNDSPYRLDSSNVNSRMFTHFEKLNKVKVIYLVYIMMSLLRICVF